MRLIGRVIAVLLLLAAALVMLQDATSWYHSGGFHPTTIGALWDRLLALLHIPQQTVQRLVTPWLWDNVIVYFFQFWAAPTFAVPGLVLFWETQRRRRRGTRLD
jgi:hypothetical protein